MRCLCAGQVPIMGQNGTTLNRLTVAIIRLDFTVDLSSYFADAKPGQQTDMTSIMMSALREQLGLNLESRKEPVEILVVDHAEKNPTGN